MNKEELEKKFHELVSASPREAAEIAYVLAVLYWRGKQDAKAKEFARTSVRLFEELRIQTLEDAAARFVTIAGVALPSLIHEGVVRERLAPLLEPRSEVV